ncbi:MAG: VOC family protein [Chloroflexota bacterium]
MFLGLRTIIYPAPDLARTKAWFSRLLGQEPYFDQPFYVGFNVGGYELGLDPGASLDAGALTYWGVANIERAVAELESQGARITAPIQDVGDGIRTASVEGPPGALIGIIENPHFQLPA